MISAPFSITAEYRQATEVNVLMAESEQIKFKCVSYMDL